MRQFRHLLWLTLLVALMHQSAFADFTSEELSPRDRWIGVHGGAAWSNLGNLGGVPQDRSGLFAGIALMKSQIQFVAVQYELDYISRGSGGEVDRPPGNVPMPNPKLSLEYVQVAALARMGGLTNPDESHSRIIPRIFLGFGIAWLLSEKWHEYDRVNSEDFKGWDSSLILGFGTDLKLSKNLLITAGLRIDIGLDDIAPGYRNRSMTATLGVVH